MDDSYQNKPFERWLMGVSGLMASQSPINKMVVPLGYYDGKIPEYSFSSIKTKNSYVPEPMDIYKTGRFPKGGTLGDTYSSDFIANNPKVSNIKADMYPELYDSEGNKAAARFDKDVFGNRSFKFTRNNPKDVVHEISHSVSDFGGVRDKALDESLAKFAEEVHGVQSKPEIINRFLGSEYDLPEKQTFGKIRNIINTAKKTVPIAGRVAGIASLPLAVFNAKDSYNKAQQAGADPLRGILSSLSVAPTTQRLPTGEIYNNQTGEKYKEWL